MGADMTRTAPHALEIEMPNLFRIARDLPTDTQAWGHSKWLSNPSTTGAARITALDATLAPRQGHDFHLHDGQEELIVVVAGTVEQWIEQERRLLGPGDAAFIPAGAVHASFNAGPEEARIVAVFGPSTGTAGFTSEDVSGEAPWNGLRS